MGRKSDSGSSSGSGNGGVGAWTDLLSALLRGEGLCHGILPGGSGVTGDGKSERARLHPYGGFAAFPYL